MSVMNQEVFRLIKEYLTGEISEDRRQELMDWVNRKEENKTFFEKFCSDASFYRHWQQWEMIDTRKAIREFDRRTGKTQQVRLIGKWRPYAAAVALLVFVLGAYFMFHVKQSEVQPVLVEQREIVPGCSKAVLIFADGQQKQLNREDSLCFELGNGVSVVSKAERLVYEQKMAETPEYNELKIPCGGEFRVVLSDGTTVHMNSASSLKYPVTFGRDKREVVLSGEAYFEVTKSTVPFYVRIGDMTVRVYGTAFNINNHAEHRIQTALVEGKVGITVKGKEEEYLLSPSQLADFDVQHGIMKISETDLNPYLAWTKGMFVFTNQTLRQIMNTLSLWYDMEVFYQNPSLQDLHFTGHMKRYDSIEHILRALSQSIGITFKQQGKTLIIGD